MPCAAPMGIALPTPPVTLPGKSCHHFQSVGRKWSSERLNELPIITQHHGEEQGLTGGLFCSFCRACVPWHRAACRNWDPPHVCPRPKPSAVLMRGSFLSMHGHVSIWSQTGTGAEGRGGHQHLGGQAPARAGGGQGG